MLQGQARDRENLIRTANNVKPERKTEVHRMETAREDAQRRNSLWPSKQRRKPLGQEVSSDMTDVSKAMQRTRDTVVTPTV